jgi:hypothetical protein
VIGSVGGVFAEEVDDFAIRANRKPRKMGRSGAGNEQENEEDQHVFESWFHNCLSTKVEGSYSFAATA